jgi:hypothetical protein
VRLDNFQPRLPNAPFAFLFERRCVGRGGRRPTSEVGANEYGLLKKKREKNNKRRGDQGAGLRMGGGRGAGTHSGERKEAPT